jgi:hypothetical protein
MPPARTLSACSEQLNIHNYGPYGRGYGASAWVLSLYDVSIIDLVGYDDDV